MGGEGGVKRRTQTHWLQQIKSSVRSTLPKSVNPSEICRPASFLEASLRDILLLGLYLLFIKHPAWKM